MEINKGRKIVNIIYWIFILAVASFYLFKETSTIQEVYSLSILGIINTISWLVLMVILKYYYVTITYFACLIYFDRIKYKIDKTDLTKEKNYYRDKINEYSPGVLSYIDNYVVGNQTLIATIMHLELKGFITANNKLKTTDLLPSNLDQNTTYVYDLIKENNLISFNLKKYNALILLDCVKHELIIKDKKVMQTRIKIFVPLVAISIFLSDIIERSSFLKANGIILAVAKNFYLINNAILIVYACFIVYSSLVGFLISKFIIKRAYNDNYRRTNLGMELNTRLNGLNSFLKDFSNLNERTKNQLILWEEYLLYSVLFNHNKKTIAEYQKIIENTKQ